MTQLLLQQMTETINKQVIKNKGLPDWLEKLEPISMKERKE